MPVGVKEGLDSFSSVTVHAHGVIGAAVIPEETTSLLRRFKVGEIAEAEVIEALLAAPFQELGFARLDTHRSLRQGFPEVVFASGKTPEQVVAIVEKLFACEGRVLVTRAGLDHAMAVKSCFPDAVHHGTARCVTLQRESLPRRHGTIAVLCAGTSDLPVAEEAAVTAEIMGNCVERVVDVGVAGLHRLLAEMKTLRRANVVIAVAGMEGALPSVVAGLIDKPIIAVPTSIGYGASLGGLAALLGMLNSCGSGVTVVNIDNGFGAGFAASQINALAAKSRPE